MIKVYTDGSCSNNGRANAKAGIGIYFSENDPRNVSERIEGKQTNNMAELTAILRVYQILKEDKNQIAIYSDSIYAIRCCGEYGRKCEEKNWPKCVPNISLLKKVYMLYKDKNNISFVYIKAHTKNGDVDSIGNKMADLLAKNSLN